MDTPIVLRPVGADPAAAFLVHGFAVACTRNVVASDGIETMNVDCSARADASLFGGESRRQLDLTYPGRTFGSSPIRGTLSIDALVGPQPLKAALLARYGDVTKARDNDLEVACNGRTLRLRHVVLSAFAGAMAAGDLAVTQGVQFLFFDAIWDDGTPLVHIADPPPATHLTPPPEPAMAVRTVIYRDHTFKVPDGETFDPAAADAHLDRKAGHLARPLPVRRLLELCAPEVSDWEQVAQVESGGHLKQSWAGVDPRGRPVEATVIVSDDAVGLNVHAASAGEQSPVMGSAP